MWKANTFLCYCMLHVSSLSSLFAVYFTRLFSVDCRLTDHDDTKGKTGSLRSEYWSFLHDVSGQRIGPILRLSFGFSIPENWTDRLSRNVCKKLPLLLPHVSVRYLLTILTVSAASGWRLRQNMLQQSNGKIRNIQGFNRRNGPDFGRVFLRSNYTDITLNTYIQSSMVTEILPREVWNFDSYYSLTDYQIHIETGRNMWFL